MHPFSPLFFVKDETGSKSRGNYRRESGLGSFIVDYFGIVIDGARIQAKIITGFVMSVKKAKSFDPSRLIQKFSVLLNSSVKKCCKLTAWAQFETHYSVTRNSNYAVVYRMQWMPQWLKSPRLFTHTTDNFFGKSWNEESLSRSVCEWGGGMTWHGTLSNSVVIRQAGLKALAD